MKTLSHVMTFAIVCSLATVAGAVDIDFDLPSGTLISNPPPDVGPPDSYHSGPIPTGALLIDPGQTMGIWVTFKDMLHLEVIDTPSNSDGVERLVTHLNGRVIPDPLGGAFTDLWVDVILTGVKGHIREAFDDSGVPHPSRPPNGDPTHQPGGRNDDPGGDWDGAYDGSGTDLWSLFHDTVRVDSESHVVNDVFTLETFADDLTDDHFLFHDIHWEITNHGPNPVEIFDAGFWQNGNIVRIGVWIPEPSSGVLIVLGLAGYAVWGRRRGD